MVFSTYQRMREKGTSWDGPIYLSNQILTQLQIPYNPIFLYPLQWFIQPFPNILLPSQSTILICFWYLFRFLIIILGNCGCVLFRWVVRSWCQGDKLPKPNNQRWSECHPHLIPPLLTPVLILLWLDWFLTPPLFLLRYYWIWCAPGEIFKEEWEG